jgi:class 3 adenylate cyclase/tetratricopeptide (TPR) repeat protein
MERIPPNQDSTDACERIRKDLEQGAPWEACDAFREAIEHHPGDADLLWWGALSHARSGAINAAHVLLDRAQAASTTSDRLTDILSMRGRLWKDAYHRAAQTAVATTYAERARKEYLAAYELQWDPFPGINAATLSWLLADRSEARRLAQEIAANLERAPPRNFWDVATAGEAQLLLGRLDQAREAYAEAYRSAADDAGSIATMRRQVALLADTLPGAQEIIDLLPVPDVIVFAGHMIDAPERSVPRFPAALAPAVDAAVRERFARFHRPIVYTSAACGADLICIETALDAGAEVNVVLPFDRADFVRTSVAIGGEGWTERFDAALGRAARVIMATDENHLGDDVLFEHAALLVEGFAMLRASQLETTPTLLCVVDPVADGRVGGTHASLERWRQRVALPQTIDLQELRIHAGLVVNSPRGDAPKSMPPPDTPGASKSDPRMDAARPQRTLKTMLFADFAGFSRVHDAVAPLFQESFLKVAAGQIEAARAKPLLASTWGDALYVVFDSPRDGADFALSFLESMRAVDWTAVGLPDSSQIRIALHAGPVFRGFDPIMGRDNYFGSSVTKAARIEPVTPPGMVYASEAFAATLASSGRNDFALEYVGRLALAKGYGESRIYRLERR